jgi:hypothetical protein
MVMKKYMLTFVIPFGVLFSLPIQAAPLSFNAAALREQAAADAVQVRHCRDLSGNCDDYTGHDPEDRPPPQRVHSRHWSHQRYGSEGGEGHSRFWSHLRWGSEYRRDPDRATHSRYWSHNRYGSEGNSHRRYWSHRRYGSDRDGGSRR